MLKMGGRGSVRGLLHGAVVRHHRSYIRIRAMVIHRPPPSFWSGVSDRVMGIDTFPPFSLRWRFRRKNYQGRIGRVTDLLIARKTRKPVNVREG